MTHSCIYNTHKQWVYSADDDVLYSPGLAIGSVFATVSAEIFPQSSVTVAAMLYVVFGTRPVILLRRPLVTIRFCAVAEDNLSEIIEGSAPMQLVHASMTVILVSVAAVACTVREHSCGPTVQYKIWTAQVSTTHTC